MLSLFPHTQLNKLLVAFGVLPVRSITAIFHNYYLPFEVVDSISSWFVLLFSLSFPTQLNKSVALVLPVRSISAFFFHNRLH